MKNKKLYSSRKPVFSSTQVKVQGIEYVPQESQQKEALLFIFAPPGLLRVRSLIEKYRMVLN